jgi:hypothetical protein
LQGLTELDEYKKEMSLKQNTNETTGAVRKAVQKQTNKHYYYLIIALNHYSFLLFFQNTKLKQKNKLKDIQSKIQENIINASVTGQEIERKNS